jgi:putative ABC transport system substrate-binding protein
MSYKKYFLLFSLLFISFFLFFYKKQKMNKKNSFHIAVFKTATHPSLNEAEKSFIDNIKNHFEKEKEIHFSLYNAEGNQVAAHAIAQKITANKDIELFYTIGSLSTQSVSFLEKQRPIIFAAVSNPHELLGEEKTKIKNVCGISDSLDSESLFDFIKKAIPSVEKIGILRSSQAFNEKECNELSMLLEQHGIHVEHLVITAENEIDTVLKSYRVSQIDGIFSPSDNIVASSIERISEILRKLKKPFLTSFYDKNASASIGISYSDIGKKAANEAKMLLIKEKNREDIGYLTLKENHIVIRK